MNIIKYIIGTFSVTMLLLANSVMAGEKSPICHFQQDNGAAKLLMLPENAGLKHLENHEHDGVPGDGDYDEACAQIVCNNPGITVDGYPGCWFLGEFTQSCDQTCDAQGLDYSELTKTVAGSANGANDPDADAACIAILAAIPAPDRVFCDGTPHSFFIVGESIKGRGCYVSDASSSTYCDSYPQVRKRIQWARDTATTESDTQIDLTSGFKGARVCACE